MRVGMIGLGRMGASMTRRLVQAGHECAVHDRDPEKTRPFAAEGCQTADSVASLLALLPPPRVVWLMLPAGAPVEETVAVLADRMEPGDTIVDGGNSHFKDDIRRAQSLSPRGIRYLDVGTSGGIAGLQRGYCLMIGGDPDPVRRLDTIWRALAPGPVPDHGRTAAAGYLHCGPVGAGHFVKMIHNGIEYGLMQAYGEGFDLLRNAGSEALPPHHRYQLPIADIAELWRHGSIVASWLLDLLAEELAADPDLSAFEGVVDDGGEGRWTVQAALEQAIPAEVITSSLYARFRSRWQHTFAEKVLASLRHRFGGHVEPPGARRGQPDRS